MYRVGLFLCVVGFAFQISVGQEQEAGESQFLHILIVGDTIDSGVGKSVEKDITALKELFESGIPVSKRHVTILADDFLTPESLFVAIDNLKVETTDSLLLYYSGHGVIDDNDNHFFNLPAGKVPRSKVREALQKKNPRLGILLSDCCAVLVPPERWAPSPHFKTINSELMRYLFFCPQGFIDINSARSGEVAFCSDVRGGLFTEKFCSLFDFPTADMIQADSDVPAWSVVMGKITELLIPSEDEVQHSGMDAPHLLEIEKTRGIRVFRDKKVPNQPVQHPVTFSALPKVSYTAFPTGDNTLGFTYHVIPGKEIQVDTVVPGSMAMWNGLEKEDSIIGFEQQRFDMTNVQEVPVPPDFAIKPRASRLDQNFDFDAFLLSSMPIASYMLPNVTPGRMQAFVRKSSDNKIVNIPVSTSKIPVEIDLTTPMPEEAREVSSPYFWQLAPYEKARRMACFDFLPDGSALVVWGDDFRNRNQNYSFERIFPDGTRKNLCQYQSTYHVNQVTLDSNGKVRAFMTVGGQPQLICQDASPDFLPNSLAKLSFFPNDTVVGIVNSPRSFFIWEYNKFIEAPPIPSDDNLRVLPRIIECPQEGQFFVHFSPETGQILTLDEEEIALWKCTNATKVKQVSSKQILPPDAFLSWIHFVPGKDLFFYQYHPQDGPRLEIWDIKEDAKHVRTMFGFFQEVCLNSTGTRLLTSGVENEIILWNWNNGKKIGEIKGVLPDSSATFSPDGKYVVGLTRGWYGEAAMLWDAETGSHLKNLGKQDKMPFRSFRFTANGKSILLLSQDGILQTVDLD
ncbi:MAG: caspase family protein [Planctomycetaceae bacterium]|jgi:WD40 repeat protein|nr:caspase family protein [Planctomycetaceae bacterium]